MVWIDNKKAYDMDPQIWIIDCLKMYQISGEVIKFIKNTMKNWTVKLTAKLVEVKIQRGIFHGGALLPLLFVIAMMPLTYLGNAQADANFINRKKISIT